VLTRDVKYRSNWTGSNSFGLPLHLRQMGEPQACGHRSGWHYVLNSMASVGLEEPLGVRLDDFVERSFQREDSDHIWNEPWVGVFHHPPNLPEWLDPTAVPNTILETPRFMRSVQNLRGCIALSHYLGSWLQQRLKVPVFVLLHPSEVPHRKFDLDHWIKSEKRSVVQVGWYARNYRAIYQLDAGDHIQKVHLFTDRPWIREAMVRTDASAPTRTRSEPGSVDIRMRVSDEEYDLILASSVVFCEYFDVSASNTVIECIARNCPILVNRLPALEEYLGADYPFFYSSIGEAGLMIRDLGRVSAAYQYLTEIPKDWLDGNAFARKIADFCHSLS
jgi:hypothetical protein